MVFVFCHGFGFDKRYWAHLAPYFAQEKCFFIDLGYFNQPCEIPPIYNQKVVGIGHSLGLLKLMTFYKNFHCLIGLNGFTNFLGNNQHLHQQREIELRALKKSLLKNPLITLKNFYHRCGVLRYADDTVLLNINSDALLSDLEFLKKPGQLVSAPILVLYSNNDGIVPPHLVTDNFAGVHHVTLENIPHTQHGLGFVQPAAVYKKIAQFIKEKCVQ